MKRFENLKVGDKFQLAFGDSTEEILEVTFTADPNKGRGWGMAKREDGTEKQIGFLARIKEVAL